MTSIITNLAAKRTESHEDRHPKHAAIRSDCDSIGLVGEVEFGKFSGICPDFTFGRKNGDGGVDFVVPLLFTVDVKTAEPGRNLIHRLDKPVAADIYVLAEAVGEQCSLVGWAWASQLKQATVRDLGHGIASRFVPREALRPMDELAERLWRVER